MGTTAIRSEVARRRSRPVLEPLALRAVGWAVVLPVAGYLLLHALGARGEIDRWLPELVAWLLIVGLIDMAPVPMWRGVELTMSLPVLLAAGMTYPAYVAGLLAFIGTVDLREFRREITVVRGLFNRSQIALSVMAGSAVFHSLHGDPSIWPGVLLVALAALLADFVVNAGLVLIWTRFLTGVPFSNLLNNVHGGAPLSFMIGYSCLGLTAVLLATILTAAGNWGLAAFLIPVLLARQMFAHGKRLKEAAEAISVKNRLLLSVSERIADERRDERLNVAAGLHDEALPPLYKVHLMGQVLRQDLASGRLLALEEDLPDLLRATEHASEAMRVLIRDLRRSSIGPGGLAGTLRLLVRDLELEHEARVRFELTLDEVGGSPIIQLLAYQVAREATRNAVRHSDASVIRILLSEDEDNLRLVIEDNGIGFVPESVDTEAHFGLQLMRERVALAGGVLHVISDVGAGTTVAARLPGDVTQKKD